MTAPTKQPQTTLKASDTISIYRSATSTEVEISFDTIDKTGVLKHPH